MPPRFGNLQGLHGLHGLRPLANFQKNTHCSVEKECSSSTTAGDEDECLTLMDPSGKEKDSTASTIAGDEDELSKPWTEPPWKDRLAAVVEEVVQHYGVPSCVIVMETPEGTALVQELGPSIRDLLDQQQRHDSRTSQFHFFRPTIMRPMPVVVPDTHGQRHLSNHPFVIGGPKIRFYAAVPTLNYKATLAMFSSEPGGDLTLDECRFLQEKAEEVGDILSQMQVQFSSSDVQSESLDDTV